ncbi:MAG: SUMF1/EgtB/PvdO family nonheme iron enzyme [Acidobacteriota bacterium]
MVNRSEGSLDFHIIVSPLAGDDEVLVTAVVRAPVSRWGDRFDRFAAASSLDELFRRLEGIELRRGEGQRLWLHRVASSRRAPGAATRDADMCRGAADQRALRERLFETLFPPDSQAYHLLGRSCQQANSESCHLRMLLEVDPRLANLPWETALCPADGMWANEIAKARMTWIRYFGDVSSLRPSPEPAPNAEPCVALVVASPEELRSPELSSSFEHEKMRLSSLFGGLGLDCVVIEGRDTFGQLLDRLPELERANRPIVGLHYIGHGAIDSRGGSLVGEGVDGRAQRIDEADLRVALERSTALRWIFFNACDTSNLSIGPPLAGLSVAMVVLANVSTVLAYQRPVATDDAVGIATKLYELMAEHGCSLEGALRLVQHRFRHAGGLVASMRSRNGRAFRWLPRRGTEPNETTGAEGPRAPTVDTSKTRRRPAREQTPSDDELRRRDPGEMVVVPAARLRAGFDADEAERLIGQVRHRRLAFDLEMLRQSLTRGSDEEIEVAAFTLDRAPVTNARFAVFVGATDYLTEAERARSPQTWRLYDLPELRDHPVVHVSSFDARQFCAWAGKRLPTAEEWMLAYRGAEGRLYPWGDDFDPARCNSFDLPHDHQTTQVTAHEAGASACGCLDLVGNVEELTATRDLQGSFRVVGGSWAMRCQVSGLPTFQRFVSRHFSSNELGFRCAR